MVNRRVFRRPTRSLSKLAATLLALVVAAGVATPRPRLGRERALRTVALAASTRPDQPCAWVPADDQDPDVSLAARDAFEHAAGLAAPAGSPAVLPPRTPNGRVVVAEPVSSADTLAVAAGARTGPPPGRAPPASRS